MRIASKYSIFSLLTFIAGGLLFAFAWVCLADFIANSECLLEFLDEHIGNRRVIAELVFLISGLIAFAFLAALALILRKLLKRKNSQHTF